MLLKSKENLAKELDRNLVTSGVQQNTNYSTGIAAKKAFYANQNKDKKNGWKVGPASHFVVRCFKSESNKGKKKHCASLKRD
jgi:hypothetical protein